MGFHCDSSVVRVGVCPGNHGSSWWKDLPACVYGLPEIVYIYPITANKYLSAENNECIRWLQTRSLTGMYTDDLLIMKGSVHLSSLSFVALSQPHLTVVIPQLPEANPLVSVLSDSLGLGLFSPVFAAAFFCLPIKYWCFPGVLPPPTAFLTHRSLPALLILSK